MSDTSKREQEYPVGPAPEVEEPTPHPPRAKRPLFVNTVGLRAAFAKSGRFA